MQKADKISIHLQTHYFIKHIVYILALCIASAASLHAEPTDSLSASSNGTLTAVQVSDTDDVQVSDSSSVSSDSSSVSSDDPDFVKVSVIYIERKRSSLSTYYGHIALRLQCPSAGLDYAFTFESGSSTNMLHRLTAIDRLALMPAPFDKFLELYGMEQRNVYEYQLNLTLEEKRNLWRLVDQYVKKGPYLKNDYLNAGCAQETASLIIAMIDGQVTYGPYMERIGHTQHELVSRQMEHGNWWRLFLYLYSSTDCDRQLTATQRLLLPTDMIAAWKEAKIECADGTIRPLMADTTACVYTSHELQHEEGQTITTTMVFTVLMIIVVLVCAIQLAGKKISTVARAVDTILLAAHTLVSLLLVLMYAFVVLPATSGWNPHFVVFNLVPFVAWAMSSRRPFNARTWAGIYICYSLVVVGMMVWMGFNPIRVDTVPEYLIMSTLLIRCVTKAVTALRSRDERAATAGSTTPKQPKQPRHA